MWKSENSVDDKGPNSLDSRPVFRNFFDFQFFHSLSTLFEGNASNAWSANSSRKVAPFYTAIVETSCEMLCQEVVIY